MNLEIYSKTELEQLSKILKKFRNLRRNVGKKSSEVLHYELTWTQRILVEYFPTLKKEDVQDETLKIFKGFFWIELNPEDITWKENEILAWGMRVFFWDDMVDLSFESMRNRLRKI
ncbi:MAG: hypothetical protein ACD_2C00073G0039 [uncultured bacterium (gcode 4)]|uniref:Uncharacterized protein n=1 Tax=uncultured bacterium (gcode 4) TaxID=1234023 RepID=K2FFH4_9BACT|nr:MAG: hypothetical protein ACD_2C00073G0039 [uncultured bacterium (gcode 4)]